MISVRERVEVDGLAGWRFAEVGDELLQDAARWLRDGHVPDAEEIREGRLYRRGEQAIKLFGRSRRLTIKDRLPRSPALRFADLHERLKPIRSPRPIVALDLRRAGKRRASLLVYEWVRGEFLAELWDRGGVPVASFPLFVAAMHRHGVWHGDFHLHNAVWDGTDWVLIDIDSIRHRFRCLAPARLAEDQWSNIWLWLYREKDVQEAGVRALFEQYFEASSVLRDSERSWRRIARRYEALLRASPAQASD